MFKRSQKPSDTISAPRDRFPTFRPLGRFTWKFATRLPFVSRAWWKRNYRRLVVVCLVLAAIWTATNIYATVLLNRELNAIRQRGEPLTLAELAPPIPDNQNAALLLKRAYAQLKYEDGDSSHLLGFYKDTMAKMPPKAVLANRKRIFERNKSVTAMIFQAAQMARFQTFSASSPQEDYFSDERMKSLGNVREFSRYMGAQAEYEAQQGDKKAALKCLATVYRLSDLVAQEPNALALLVAIPVEQNGHAALARVLDIEHLSPFEAKTLDSALPQSDLDNAFKRSMQFERMWALPYFTEFKLWWRARQSAGSSQEIEELTPTFWERALFFGLAPQRKLDGATYLRFYEKQNVQLIPWYAVMTKELLPSSTKVKPVVERTQDMREIARIALALNLWKQTHQSYPKSLDELNALPTANLQNALNRKTIGYKTQGDGFLLYSFGLNRRDDGGKINGFDPMNPSAYTATQTSPTRFDDGDDIAWRQSIGTRLRPSQ